METDLEVSRMDWCLLGIFTFLDALTNRERERQTDRQTDIGYTLLSLPHLWAIGRLFFCKRGKDPGETEWEGCFSSNNIVLCFISNYKSNLYSESKIVEIQKSSQIHQLFTVPLPRDNPLTP